MKYKAMFNASEFLRGEDLLHTLLKNRGVDNPSTLLNLKEDCILDGMILKNMREGLRTFDKWMILAKSKLVRIAIIVDEDADGYTSACATANYIWDIAKEEELQVEIIFLRHGKKAHCINVKHFEGKEVDLLIVPDAGSNDVEACKELYNRGIDIIILDHHNIEEGNPYAIVINCKDGEYPNNTLSGVGIVYKFCKEYDKALGYNYADKYLDLFALGNIGDIMDLRNEETRYLTLEGIKRFVDNNLFLKELVEKREYDIKGSPNITKIGWYVAPLINAVTRVGTEEERDRVFRALLGDEETITYKPRKSKNNPEPQEEEYTLQKFMAKECINIKSRQDRLTKKGMEQLESNPIVNDKLLVVDATGILEKDFTGLVANKLASKYKKPVITLKKYKDNIYGGSGRNYKLSPIKDLNEFLTSLEVFDKVAGHDNSFGINIQSDKIEEFIYKSAEALKDVIMEDVYKVDYEIPMGRLKTRHIQQVGEWADLWGNKLDEPLFAITDIYVNSEDIKLMGEKKNFIKMQVRDIAFVKKFTNEEEYCKMIMKNLKGLNKERSKRLKIDIVGKFVINEWDGGQSPQVEIIDFNVVKDSEVRF